MTQAEEQSQAALAEGAKWVSRMRDQPPRSDMPQADPKVWTPPAYGDTYMMPDPREYPYPPYNPFSPYPSGPERTLTWNEYWQLFSYPRAADPVLESDNPRRIRLKLGSMVPPYSPHGGLGSVQKVLQKKEVMVRGWISKPQPRIEP